MSRRVKLCTFTVSTKLDPIKRSAKISLPNKNDKEIQRSYIEQMEVIGISIYKDDKKLDGIFINESYVNKRFNNTEDQKDTNWFVELSIPVEKDSMAYDDILELNISIKPVYTGEIANFNIEVKSLPSIIEDTTYTLEVKLNAYVSYVYV